MHRTRKMRFSSDRRSTITAAAAATQLVLLAAALLLLSSCCVSAFGISAPARRAFVPSRSAAISLAPLSPVVLKMSDAGGGGGGGGSGERQRSTKKGLKTITIEKTEQKQEEEEKKEEMWRVILHNDEINTFQHVTRAICEVITTLDRKRAFDICMETHGIGKATLSKTWKKKAEQYCLNLQRQGLTVSIVPDKAFGGGGGGDGGGEGGGGGGSGGPDMS